MQTAIDTSALASGEIRLAEFVQLVARLEDGESGAVGEDIGGRCPPPRTESCGRCSDKLSSVSSHARRDRSLARLWLFHLLVIT